jgi:hypothetical protein
VTPARRNDRWGITLEFGTERDGTNMIWLGDDVRKIAAEQERLQAEEAVA